MKQLVCGDWIIEVEASAWAEMLLLLSKAGWQPTVPSHSLLASSLNVSEGDALSLAHVGRVSLDEALKNPLAAYSKIKFDMGKFAEIIELASQGPFVIRDKS